MAHPAEKRQSWLNRNVLGMSLTSLLSDTSHEMTTAILPAFILLVGGNPAVVGLVEGASDGSSSLVKAYSGYYSDRTGRRTPIMRLGYILTGLLIPLIGSATSWLQVLALRVGAWVGRGARGPPRDALLVDSVPPGNAGKAFGFERTFDTVGAVLGPGVAAILIPFLPLFQIFLFSAIPGAACVAVVFLLVREVRRKGDHAEKPGSFRSSLVSLPRSFKLFLVGAGLFGIANFSNVIFILRAVQVLQPTLGNTQATELGVLLYVLLNVVYALGSFPAGLLADKVPKGALLACGYLVFAAACVASIFETPDLAILVTVFTLAGLHTAIVDTVERAYASDLLPGPKGTGFGVLQTVNGVGDFVSSALIGVLLTVFSPSAGFITVASLSVAAAFLILLLPRRVSTA